MVHPGKEESTKAYLGSFPLLLKVIHLADKPGISRLVTAEYHIHTANKCFPEAQAMHFYLGTQAMVAVNAVPNKSQQQPHP